MRNYPFNISITTVIVSMFATLTLAFRSKRLCALVQPHRAVSMAADSSRVAVWPLCLTTICHKDGTNSKTTPHTHTHTHCSSITSYLEPTTKHLIIVAALTVINVLCPAGVKTTAACAIYWLALCVC